jgi:septation ring formation regulator EzrA
MSSNGDNERTIREIERQIEELRQMLESLRAEERQVRKEADELRSEVEHIKSLMVDPVFAKQIDTFIEHYREALEQLAKGT